MKRALTWFKHFFIIFVILTSCVVGIAVGFGVDADYGDNPLAYKIGGEGPHIFFEGDELVTNYIRGNRDDGFYAEQQRYPMTDKIIANVHFTLENNDFSFEVDPKISIPNAIYHDDQPILAISDIESGFKTFRDFLMANQVIDETLNWTFGKGHLVLVGDFVDRGFSTTQTLWFIYKLEQSAKARGGHVHFILGNHEIKNLQGNFQKAAYKYFHIASVMGKQQLDLFSDNALLGRWLTSKNTIELINGQLFVHGGLHPEIAELDYSLKDINQIVRDSYTQAYFPKPGHGDEDLLLNTRTGPSWYRGYFEANLSQAEVEQSLNKFTAQAVIVGHTPQWRVKKLYKGKVFAIDVKHPRDYRGSFPPRSSEGLLIADGQYYRIMDDGTKHQL